MALVIVARDQPALFGYMRWGFAKVREVRVILDRRLGSRRDSGAGQVPAQERRGADRRRRPRMSAELAARGFVIVRL